MKKLTVLLAVAAGFGVAAAAPGAQPAGEPVKLTKAQLDKIVAGDNGTNPNSNGASGAPGGSWDGGKKSPGHTGNPHPGQ